MEQHPIPQQISSYQFKLVGDMTLKQFFQVAGGVVVSFIIYSAPLYAIIKWPLVLLSAGLGAALAFLPFQERPLERWIFAFFRSIYSPTLYFWRKTEKPPVFYTEEAVAPAITTVANTSPVVENNTVKLENAEKSFLSKIGGLWSTSNSTTVQNTNQTPINRIPPTAPIQTHDQDDKTTTNNQSATTTTPTVSASLSLNSQSDTNTTVNIPQQVPTVVTRTVPKLVVEETSPPITQKVDSKPLEAIKIEPLKVETKPLTTNVVEFSVDAAPPSPPIAINTISGQVMDMDRKIIEGAILEIKDSNNRPVRALKSNKAGHFIIVTPLANGKYEVIVEKDGFKFEPVTFEAKGEMIPAIAIRGTRIA